MNSNILKEKIKSWLIWSQQYTKTDMVYLVKNGSWLSSGQFIATIISLGASITFAHFFSKEAYGNYRYVLSIIAIISIFRLPGMNSTVARSVAQNNEGGYLKAVKEKIKWGMLGIPVTAIIALYYYLHGNHLLASAFGVVLVFIPFSETFSIYSSFLAGRKNYAKISLYNTLTTAVSTLAVIAFIFLSPPSIPGLLITFLGTGLLMDLLWFFLILKKFPPNHQEDPETLHYGKYLSKIDILNTITGQLDKIIIFQFMGSAELAIYLFAILLPEHAKGYIKNFIGLASPKIAQQKTMDSEAIFRHAARLGLASLFLCLIYIFLAPFAYNLFYPQYRDAIIFSQFFSLSLIIVGPIFLFYTFLESHAAKKELTTYNIYENLISLTTLVIGIAWWGVWGAIGSRVLIRFFDLGFLAYLVKKVGRKST